MRPLLKASLTSCCLFIIGDGVAQVVVEKRSFQSLQQDEKYDWNRTARFAVIGACLHGPYFNMTLRMMDKLIKPKKNIYLTAIEKSLFSQVTAFPVYICAFLSFSGLLEGHSPPDTLDNVQKRFWAIFLTGTCLWPAANVITFTLPSAYRIAYLNVVGIAWNSYLSFTAHSK